MRQVEGYDRDLAVGALLVNGVLVVKVDEPVVEAVSVGSANL